VKIEATFVIFSEMFDRFLCVSSRRIVSQGRRHDEVKQDLSSDEEYDDELEIQEFASLEAAAQTAKEDKLKKRARERRRTRRREEQEEEEDTPPKKLQRFDDRLGILEGCFGQNAYPT
jgi:hypothetical protein